MFIFYIVAVLLGFDGFDRLDKAWDRGMIEIGAAAAIALVAVAIQVFAPDARGGPR